MGALFFCVKMKKWLPAKAAITIFVGCDYLYFATRSSLITPFQFIPNAKS